MTTKNKSLSFTIIQYTPSEVQTRAIKSVQFAVDQAKEYGVPLCDYDLGSYSQFWEDCSGYDACVNGAYADRITKEDTEDDHYYNIAVANSQRVYKHATDIITAMIREDDTETQEDHYENNRELIDKVSWEIVALLEKLPRIEFIGDITFEALVKDYLESLDTKGLSDLGREQVILNIHYWVDGQGLR